LLLKSLNRAEIKNAGIFIEGNFYKTKADSIKLFDYLRTSLDKQLVPTKNDAFGYCYPGQIFNDAKLRLNMAHCLKQLERYIVFSRLESDAFANQKSIILQRYYRENHLSKSFNSEILRYKKLNDQNSLSHYDLLEENFKHEFEIYEYKSRENRKQTHNLKQLYNQSEILYYARKIKLACYLISHSNVYQQELDFVEIDKIKHAVESKDLLDYPSIAAYYYGYCLLSSPDDMEMLKTYKQYIDTHFDKFPFEENRTLYFIAINNCIKNFNKGGEAYGLMGLEFYKIALKNKILFVDGFLTRFTYRNIAMLALRTKELEWAESFTIKYAPHLRKKDRQSAYSFNLSLISFYQANFSLALEHIQDADFKDHLIYLAAKNLQCKIYFELSEFDALDFLLSTLKAYITRNKILGYHRESYLNTITFYNKLNKLNQFDSSRVLKLKKQIENEKVLLDKNWFIEKISNFL